MRKKVSINIFLTLVLIFSLFPVYPPRIAAAPQVISPIDGRTTFDGTILDFGYIAGDTINNYSESTFKFNGIDSTRSIDSSYIAFESFEGYWTTISNLKIAITSDNWPGTATVMPTLVTPEKSINSSVPGIFSSINPYNPALQINTYRIDVSSLMTSSNIGADGIISLLMSTTSIYDAEILDPRLEINYAAAPVNTAPVLSGIGIKWVNEKNLLTFTATASDAEGDTLTYSLGNAPTGASINSTTGVFTWTPTEAQGPDYFTIKVIVSDGALTDEEDIIVTVNEINEAPVLGAIGNKTVNEDTLITFTATATDADLPANTLTFSLVGAPLGASINPITGVFTWTPTEAQGPGSYAFIVRVSDGTQIDSEQITITVNEINAAPILGAIGNKTVDEGSQLTFTATATDSDSAILTYSLVGAPTGASINATTGVFTWMPSEAQGPGTYPFIVRVSDGTLTDDESITVTVNEVNVAPVLATIGDKTVNEGSQLTFTASATDTDLPANTLTYSLVGAPTGASINATTGVFTWTPTEAQGPGSYMLSVRVSDGVLTDEEEITITVNEVNTAPVLAAIGDKTVDEETLLTFTAVGTDTDLPANTLTYSLVNAPAGASINPTTGVFTWTPTEAQGPGSYPFTFRVSDGLLTDEEQITVTVNEVNAAPVLSAIGDKTIDEGSQLTFKATATDSDSAILTYSLVGAPTGASINATTGVFTWTPSEVQGPFSYTFTVHVSDGVLTDEEEITVTVNEVNIAPVLATISDKAINEGSQLTFTATATDVDLPANTLTYSLVDAPTGASINATTGVFTWTPIEAQGPGSFTFKVVVSDGALTDEEEITVTVNEINTAPILAAIGDKTVDEETLLTFTAVGTDADLPANTLTYSLVDAPTGANINAITGVFTWTPTEAQGPGNYTFTISVSDGLLTDEEEITVTVNEVNTAPVLVAIGDKTIDEESQLTFTATAADSDSAILTYSLIDAPTGASINATTGVFTWTPTEIQGPSSYTFTVHVSDGELTDEEEITVTVNEVNVAPVLATIGDKTVDEGSELTFTASATDADLPANTLTYSLVDAPTGTSINTSTGVFTWTPTEAQGPGSFTFKVVVSDGAITDDEEITVTVNEVNTAPVLAAIGDKTVDEETLFTFTAMATDVDLPANTLTFSLVDAPTGASINATTGVFIWTPTEAQGPGSFTFKVIVSDGVLTDEEEITVTVNEVNTAPVLVAIGDKTVDEESELTFTATAADPDSAILTYSLIDAPTGASINSTTGVFTWTPTEAQGPSSYTFTVHVSDGVLTDEEEITVTVNEVNTAPVLAAIGDKTVDEGSELTFTATATDVDLPANILTYSLTDAPTGASINATTGVFTWTPTEVQGPSSYTFTVRVSDGVSTDEEEITVTVNEVNTAPVLTVIGDKTVDEETQLKFTAVGTDADLPANTLTYSLVDAPTGASINATTGVFTWTPTETQGAGSYTFEIVVSDGVLSDSEEITVTVNEVNVAPVLQAIGNKSVYSGSHLSFTAKATDEDNPANTLTYSLVDAPEGAVIDSQTGEFTWQPSAMQGSKSYTFTVKVSDGLLTDEETITVTVNAVYTSEPSGNAIHVLVNGKAVDAGTATISGKNGQKVITVAVDEQKLMQHFEGEGKQVVITIPVTTDSNVVIAEINGRTIKNLAKQQATIVLQTNNASYTIPVDQIDITAIASQLGVNVALEDVKLKIEIAEPLKNMLQIVEAAFNREGLTQVAPTLNFKVSVEYDGRTVEISKFNSYVKRTIAIPEGTNPNQITTGVVVEPDGSVSHVPTQITKVGDRYYAVIYSLTNSTYSVVWNPLQFIDVENHWAKAAVNNMGSKMVINGIGNGMYHPDQDITRAEFAAIIVRGLGLRLSQENSLFTDIGTTAWYRSAVQTAYEYGLINGFEDGTFRPNDKITREQAMLMVSKAMLITGLKESAASQSNVDVIREFTDASIVSEWALEGVADSVGSGIISGRNNNLLAPKANITRAEVAMVIQRLLQTSDLINR
ncbi:MAG: putative Ig domain-containing protein [Candidatus Pristimantibacillus lignocellulolyticus]|uniref:Ig domain-containing protein n=1 Tax=Candidatus Pristimantibacillus lignocellulolyticus TaxID=2994561 RepID=A0A9J6ZG24_9BACL|nr:MAG: putative Ig domain-containing protein [Candidatus Pristimantibacillus lignocellulolyticus]